MLTRKPYKTRTDFEKIQSQWNKISGLYTRKEWSAAIVRVATAAEIAANFAIRKEFESKSEFNSEFINSLLIWANGIAGKIRRLLVPLSEGEKHHKTIKKLEKLSEQINKKRNAVTHQGEFCNEEEAKAAVQQSREFIETLVRIYEPAFALKDKKSSDNK